MGYKFNPFTGTLDRVDTGGGGTSPDNFSYTQVDDGVTVIVPENQQMLYAGDIRILGDLRVLGEIREVDRVSYDAFGLGTVPVGEVVVVPPNKILFYRNLRVLGDLRILGDIVEV